MLSVRDARVSGNRFDNLSCIDNTGDINTASTNKNPKPWERQEGESAKAFYAFEVWRGLGSKRTYKRTAEAMGRLPSYINQLSRWAFEYDWKVRLGAYEDHRAKQRRLKEAREAKKMIRRHAKVADMALEVVERSLAAFENSIIDKPYSI